MHSPSKFKSAASDLKRISHKILDKGAQSKYDDHLDQTLYQFEGEELQVEILVLSQSAPDLEKLGEVGSQLSSSDGVYEQHVGGTKIRWHDADHFRPKKVGELQSRLKYMVILGNPNVEDEDFSYALQRVSKDTMGMVVYADASFESMAFVRTTGSKAGCRVVPKKLEELNLENPMESVDKELLAEIRFYSAFVALGKHSEALDLHLDNEKKDFDAKKMTLQKELDTHKRASTKRSGQELFMQIKNQTQRNIAEFERGINDRFNALVKPQAGSLLSLIEDEIDGLTALKEVKDHAGSKLVIPEIDEEILERITLTFSNHLSNDVISLNDFLEATVDEIREQAQEIGIEHLHVNYDKMTDNQVGMLVTDLVRYEKEFDSKSIPKGFMAVFSAARQPVMLVVMSVSIVGYFVDQQLVKNSTIFPYIIGAAVILGVYSAVTKTRKEKLVKMNEEVKKAKAYLKAEVKRILSTLEKEWKPQYITFLKSQGQLILEDVEYALRKHQEDSGQKASENLMISQKKAQSLNMQEKELEMGKRDKVNFDTKLKQFVMELKRDLIKKMEAL